MAEVKPNKSIMSMLLGGDNRASTHYQPHLPYPTGLNIEKYGAGAAYGTPMAPYAEGVAAREYTGPRLERLFGRSTGEVARFIENWDDSRPYQGHRFGPPLPEPNPLRDSTQAKDIPWDTTHYYKGAALAANRSALAGLGLGNPSKFKVDPRPVPKTVGLGGTYVSKVDDKDVDFGWAGTGIDGGDSGTNLAHEAVHRGFKILERDPRTSEALKEIRNKGHFGKFGSAGSEKMTRDVEVNLIGSSSITPRYYDHTPTTDPIKQKMDQLERETKGGEKADLRGHIIRVVQDMRGHGFTIPKDKSKPITFSPNRYWYTIPKNIRADVMSEALAAHLIKERRPGGPR